MKNQRIASLDLVRTVAIFFVVLLHSVSLNGALGEDMNTVWWSVNLYIRHLSFCCVPIFIILSGYLQRNKGFSLIYYKGIIPIGLSYILISLLSLAAKAISSPEITLTPAYVIARLLDFTANDYAWYFEMYVGLFLLIPFLNSMYNGLNGKNSKLALILTLSFLTLMSETLKGFSGAYSPNGGGVIDIIPDFFASLYPLTYYFIGAYFAEYKPFSKTRRSVRLILALLMPALPSALCYAYSHIRASYAWYMMNGFNTLTVALTAISVFALLYDIEIKNSLICKCVGVISGCTFEIYLYSFIFDSFCYAYFRHHHVIMIAVVFVGSFIAAFLTKLILIKPLSSVITKLYLRIVQPLEDRLSKCVQTQSDK